MARDTRVEELAPDDRELVDAARAAALRAHAPFSGLQVGAALLLADRRVAVGCNVESASYGLTMCAERVAVGRAVSDRGTPPEGSPLIVRVAVSCERLPLLLPCGACRQVLSEFASPETDVLSVGADGAVRILSIAELLPEAIGPSDITP